MELIEYPPGLRVRVLTREERKHELRERLADYERRHGCSSAEKLASLGGGRYDESADVAFWMTDYRAYLRLQERERAMPAATPAVTA